MIKNTITHHLFFLAIIVFVGLMFRIYGLNWDQNQHLHPDERFLTMVTRDISWPKTFEEYLNPEVSALNPYNNNYGFFVYGTFPMKIIKFASEFIVFDSYQYNNITLVGRYFSALFDVGTIIIIFAIAKIIFNKKTALIAAFLYAISVLSIQLSHFYAVDTFLVFFSISALYMTIKSTEKSRSWIYAIFSGLFFGLALASKLSALYILPLILTPLLVSLFTNGGVKNFIYKTVAFLITCYIVVRMADPRMFETGNFLDFSLNPTFTKNIATLKSFSDPDTLFPPAIQWIKTKSLIFPLKNMVLFGLGLPLGLISIASVFYSLFTLKGVFLKAIPNIKNLRKITPQNYFYLAILVWTIGFFSYQGVQFVKAMRYFYLIYPFLAIMSANFLSKILPKKNYLLLVICYLLLSIWPLSFVQIYSSPHSRVQASMWIYKNIPAGSNITCEHWDDCLPLSVSFANPSQYTTEILEMFNTDTKFKWEKINKQIKKSEYIILSSNRVWGSIPTVPEKYPETSEFYQTLFSEQKLPSGDRFVKVAEITSYPTIPFLNIQIPDDFADESFTVYDHPKIMIYRKK